MGGSERKQKTKAEPRTIHRIETKKRFQMKKKSDVHYECMTLYGDQVCVKHTLCRLPDTHFDYRKLKWVATLSHFFASIIKKYGFKWVTMKQCVTHTIVLAWSRCLWMRLMSFVYQLTYKFIGSSITSSWLLRHTQRNRRTGECEIFVAHFCVFRHFRLHIHRNKRECWPILVTWLMRSDPLAGNVSLNRECVNFNLGCWYAYVDYS